ncbi:MAG: response regulator [Caldilineaceae bacterium]|nr:response regulator [Caldilineaceae bacterium]
MPLSLDATSHILIVDDEPLHRRLISLMLNRAGYTVETAQNGREALVKIRMNRPATIILDLEMPELSGLDLLAKMAEDPMLTTIPTIVVSANADKPEARKALAHYYTFVDVIQKPFLQMHLLERVRQAQQPKRVERNGFSHRKDEL